MSRFQLNDRTTEIVFSSVLKHFSDHSFSVFIIDERLSDLYPKTLKTIVSDRSVFLLNPVEKNKNIETVKEIYKFFQSNGVRRDTMITGIGGGITTDIASFAASTFKRGCKLTLVPTTFLAMIDAAIGGKTAVNFGVIKNSVGTFFPADEVLIDTDFLSTLPEHEIVNGFAECVKVALIDNGNLLKRLKEKKQVINESILMEAIKIKMEICKEDLYDNGKRQLLNLGHSIGHVLETETGFKLSHGISVALGMKVIASISEAEGIISSKRSNEILDLLKKYDLESDQRISIDRALISKTLKQDKKNREFMSLILFKENGVFIQKMHLDKAIDLIEEHLNKIE